MRFISNSIINNYSGKLNQVLIDGALQFRMTTHCSTPLTTEMTIGKIVHKEEASGAMGSPKIVST